jgi:hypothetical protein
MLTNKQQRINTNKIESKETKRHITTTNNTNKIERKPKTEIAHEHDQEKVTDIK